jgi:hypothetical protein
MGTELRSFGAGLVGGIGGLASGLFSGVGCGHGLRELGELATNVELARRSRDFVSDATKEFHPGLTRASAAATASRTGGTARDCDRAGRSGPLRPARACSSSRGGV